MATPHVLDIAALLEPIPGAHPAGVSLRWTETYDAIEEARREDLPIEDDSLWKREVKIANWPAVIDLATTALTTQSKDLQIAVWLTEAVVKQHGFAGLRDGLWLLRGLLEHFWETLHPEMQDGNLELRIGPFQWLHDELPVSIKATSVTHSVSGANYAFLDWEESRRIDNLRGKQEAFEAALAEGKITGEQFNKAVAATQRTFYDTLFEDLSQSREACVQLDQELNDKCGRDAPGLQGIKKAIEDCGGLVERIRPKPAPVPPPDTTLPDHGQQDRHRPDTQPSDGHPNRLRQQAQDVTSPGVLPLEPGSRVDAFRRLEAVAAYFRRTEPQSPVSYAIELAVRWGEMSLAAWLREVIKGEDVLSQVFERLGVQQIEEPIDPEGAQQAEENSDT